MKRQLTGQERLEAVRQRVRARIAAAAAAGTGGAEQFGEEASAWQGAEQEELNSLATGAKQEEAAAGEAA